MNLPMSCSSAAVCTTSCSRSESPSSRGDLARVARDGRGVARRHLVAQRQRLQHRAEQPDLERCQLARAPLELLLALRSSSARSAAGTGRRGRSRRADRSPRGSRPDRRRRRRRSAVRWRTRRAAPARRSRRRLARIDHPSKTLKSTAMSRKFSTFVAMKTANTSRMYAAGPRLEQRRPADQLEREPADQREESIGRDVCKPGLPGRAPPERSSSSCRARRGMRRAPAPAASSRERARGTLPRP